MSESQFAEALRTALDEETSGLTARPDAARRARRHGRRRKATRGLLASVPAIALAVGGSVVAAHATATSATGAPATASSSPAGRATGTSAPAASHPHVLTAAYVTKKVEAALSNDNYIVESTISGETGLTVLNDLRTGNSEIVLKQPASPATAWATYFKSGNQWSQKVTVLDETARIAYGFTSSGANTVPPADNSVLPAELKQDLGGAAALAGQGVIDGKAVMDLRVTQTYSPKDVWSAQDFWVDVQTFQILKVTTQESPALQALNVGANTFQSSHPMGLTALYLMAQEANDPDWATTIPAEGTVYYQWLPRTKALVAQVDTPRVPAGYHKP
jgi:hypothetical protein